MTDFITKISISMEVYKIFQKILFVFLIVLKPLKKEFLQLKYGTLIIKTCKTRTKQQQVYPTLQKVLKKKVKLNSCKVPFTHQPSPPPRLFDLSNPIKSTSAAIETNDILSHLYSFACSYAHLRLKWNSLFQRMI